MAVAELLRAVCILQAYVRGYLVRKKFQCLHQDYESIVKEIEEGVDLLEWDGKQLLRPKFKNRDAEVKGMNGVSKKKIPETPCHEGEENGICPLFVNDEPEKDGARQTFSTTGNIHTLSEQLESPGTPIVVPALPEPAPNKIEGVIQLLEMEKTSPASDGERKDSDTTMDLTDVTSVWNSTSLELSSNVISTEPLYKLQKREMPATLQGLQKYRSSLAMELLWLQQAISSRKNYLMLKQRLGTPE